MKTVQELVLELEKLSEAYYAGDELVSDATFDALEEELRQADPNNAWFKRNRESVSGGFGVKFPHPYQFIGSIDKIHSVAESKIMGYEYAISAKLDGSSIVIYFTDGKLDRALTRGDGYYGFDVTDKFLKIAEKYAWTIPVNFTGAIRGEVMMSQANWVLFKQLHPEAKAPRNSATGLLNNKIVHEDLKYVDCVVHGVVESNIVKAMDIWKVLEKFNLPVVPHGEYCAPLTHKELENLYTTYAQIYPIDGLVIHEVKAFVLGGKVEAYKFQAETKIVEILDIAWQMGRTGKFTPVVIIPPTELSGAIVQNVTAHNAGTVKEKGIGVGATIAVYRSGEVIPYLHEVLTPAAINIPAHCPHCGAELNWTDSGKDIVCQNATCPELRKLAVYKYLESVCKDIKGLGDAFLKSFVAELNATCILSLLQNAASWGDKPFTMLGRADNLIAKKVLAMISVEQINPENFLVGLGIPLLGETFARELAADRDAFSKVFNAILAWYDTGEPHGTSTPDWEVYDSIFGKLTGRNKLANNVLDVTPEIQKIFKFIFDSKGSFVFKSATPTATRFYAITGSLSKGRKEIEAELALAGWAMTDNINKAEFLINNDNTSNSSKNLKAQAAGKPILTEAEFRAKYL